MGSGHKIQQNAAPTTGDDLVNKTYADSIASGLDVKVSVRVATAAALPAYARVGNVITASALTNINTAGVDGVTTLVALDRILLKDGAAGADNGIYEVTVVGSTGVTAFVLTRTADADNSPAGEVTAGMFTFVEEGTANGDQGWILTTNNPIVLNTTALTFTQFSSATIISTLDSLSDVDVTGSIDGALLRYESTGSQWNDTISLLYTDAGQLQATTTGSAGGILLGGDVQWYRNAADVMRTPDALVVDGVTTLTGLATLTAGATTATGSYTTTGSGGFTASGSGALSLGSGNMSTTSGTLSVGSTSTLTGLVTATGGVTTATGSYTTTGSGSFTASGTGVVSTNSGNISSTSGNLVITAGTASIGGTSTLTGKVTMSAAQKVAVSAVKTTAYTASVSTDHIIRVDSSGAAFTVSLPAGHTVGDTIVIKDVTGSCGTNNVTIDPNSAETIDQLATYPMSVNYQSVAVVSDGTNWLVY